MQKSDTIDKLAKALLAAQKKIGSAAKDGENPHFGSSFATLSSVIDAVKSPLNEEGISFLQFPAPSAEGHLAVTTVLIHESGQFIGDTASVPLQKSDPQGYGSAITYARRYGLASIVGLKTVDDDAEAAVGRGGQGVINTPVVNKFKLGGGKKPTSKVPVKGKTGMFPSVTEDENEGK